MENVVTLLDGKTINVDLTNIFYSSMKSIYYYMHDVVGDNVPLYYQIKKAMFATDISTNNNWDYTNGNPNKLAEGNNDYPGGYVNYNFTIKDIYSNNIEDETPQYFVDNCVTIFYYTDDAESETYDASISLRFPPIIYFTYDYNGDGYSKIIATDTILSSKTVTLQTHPYSNQGYSFDYSRFRTNYGTIYKWIDYSGNCDLSYNGNSIYNYSDSSVNAPSFEIGFQKKDLSFHTRDNVKSKYSSNSSPSYPGWIELKINMATLGIVRDFNKSYSSRYNVENLKIRIIKVKLLSGEQRFFIGSNYPTDVKISNSSGTLVQVKEIWLGNVKVWPSSSYYDFDNPDSSTNANIQINLKCTRFDFYLTTDETTKYGDGITDGSIFVSVGYVIEDYNDNSHIYNVHQAAYDKRSNSGIFSGCNAAQYYTQIKKNDNSINDKLLLICGDNNAKPYYITFNSGEEIDVRHERCSSTSNCKQYFNNINQFTPITLSVYLCCAKPNFSSGDGYYVRSALSNGTDIKGGTLNKRIKIGEYKYDSKDIYKFASKELMDNTSIIYKGANCKNILDYINSYTPAQMNTTGVVKGYLNTIKKTTWHLGAIGESNVNINFVANIYAAPVMNQSPENVPSQVYSFSNYPIFLKGNCKYREYQIVSNGSGSYGSTTNMTVNNDLLDTISYVDHSLHDLSNDTYKTIYDYQVTPGEGNLYIGAYIPSEGSLALCLLVQKNCSAEIVTPKTGAGASFDGITAETCFNITPISNTSSSHTWGYFSKVPNTSTGYVRINITVAKTYSTAESYFYPSSNNSGQFQDTNFVGILVTYPYVSNDSVEVIINQDAVVYNGTIIVNDRTVVSGYIDAFGGFNYVG